MRFARAGAEQLAIVIRDDGGARVRVCPFRPSRGIWLTGREVARGAVSLPDDGDLPAVIAMENYLHRHDGAIYTGGGMVRVRQPRPFRRGA